LTISTLCNYICLKSRQTNELISDNQQSNDKSLRSSQDIIQNIGTPLKSDNSRIILKDEEINIISFPNEIELKLLNQQYATSPDDQINQSSDKKFNGTFIPGNL
jgi:hypothetical protein